MADIKACEEAMCKPRSPMHAWSEHRIEVGRLRDEVPWLDVQHFATATKCDVFTMFLLKIHIPFLSKI